MSCKMRRLLALCATAPMEAFDTEALLNDDTSAAVTPPMSDPPCSRDEYMPRRADSSDGEPNSARIPLWRTPTSAADR